MSTAPLRVPDLVSQGLDIPYPQDKVLLDYVYVTNNRLDLQHKTKVVDKEPKSFEGKWAIKVFKVQTFKHPLSK